MAKLLYQNPPSLHQGLSKFSILQDVVGWQIGPLPVPLYQHLYGFRLADLTMAHVTGKVLTTYGKQFTV
jgi:hypothetical protein